MPMTDSAFDALLERVDAALDTLKTEHGFWVAQGEDCCQSCAFARAIEEGCHADSDVAFYHDQDRESALDSGTLYLAYHGQAQLLCKVLREHGLAVDWDGDDGIRIAASLPKQ